MEVEVKLPISLRDLIPIMQSVHGRDMSAVAKNRYSSTLVLTNETEEDTSSPSA